MRKTARFWTMANGSAVRIKIRKDQELSYSHGGQTDEGFSYTGLCWQFDGEEVTISVVTNAYDCDGPISHFSTSRCPVADLTAGYNDPGDDILYPKWRQVSSSQRDYNAEAAGY